MLEKLKSHKKRDKAYFFVKFLILYCVFNINILMILNCLLYNTIIFNNKNKIRYVYYQYYNLNN